MKILLVSAIFLISLSQAVLAAKLDVVQRPQRPITAGGAIDAVGPAGPVANPSPADTGCGPVVMQGVPDPLEGVSIEVLQRASAVLAVALRLLKEETTVAETTIDAELLRKSVRLARHLRVMCATGDCDTGASSD